MNCYFCHNELEPSHGWSTSYYCLHCPHEVRYYDEDSAGYRGTEFKIRYQGFIYSFVFHLDVCKFYILGEGRSNGDKLIALQTWQFLPDITPYNVLSKLPLLLGAFS